MHFVQGSIIITQVFALYIININFGNLNIKMIIITYFALKPVKILQFKINIQL